MREHWHIRGSGFPVLVRFSDRFRWLCPSSGVQSVFLCEPMDGGVVLRNVHKRAAEFGGFFGWLVGFTFLRAGWSFLGLETEDSGRGRKRGRFLNKFYKEASW